MTEGRPLCYPYNVVLMTTLLTWCEKGMHVVHRTNEMETMSRLIEVYYHTLSNKETNGKRHYDCAGADSAGALCVTLIKPFCLVSANLARFNL